MASWHTADTRWPQVCRFTWLARARLKTLVSLVGLLFVRKWYVGNMPSIGAPETLAEQLEIEKGGNPIDYDLASKIVGALRVKKLLVPDTSDPRPPLCNFVDLPVKTVDPWQDKHNAIHFLDVILGFEGLVDHDKIKGLMLQNKVGDLGVPFSPKAAIAVPFAMNLCILKKEDGTHDIYKHFILEERLLIEQIKTVIHGDLLLINFGSNKRAGAKPFVYMWQRLGGHQYHYLRLGNAVGGSKKDLESEDAIDRGYDYINLECPRRNNNNQQARWLDKQLNNPDSPIFGWATGRVLSAIRNLKEGAQHAESEELYPLTFFSFEPWFQSVLKPHLPRLDQETLLWLGRAGAGKTPAQYILGFAMSRLHIAEDGKTVAPSVRVAPDMDHFKNEVGSKYRSTIFDDGDIDRVPTRKTKAFFDAKKKASLTVERYTASKFVLKEFRTAADNKVDLDAEPSATVDGKRMPLKIGYSGTSDSTFLNMIRPAFPKEIIESDISAILKRCTVIVNTKWWVYVRPASEYASDKMTTERHALRTKMFITPEAKETLSAWSQSGAWPDEEEFDKQVAAEQELFKNAIGNSSGEIAASSEVKQEMEDKFFRTNAELARAGFAMAVDASPEPASKRRRLSLKTASPARCPSAADGNGREWWFDLLAGRVRKLSVDCAGAAIDIEDSQDSPEVKDEKDEKEMKDENVKKEIKPEVEEPKDENVKKEINPEVEEPHGATLTQQLEALIGEGVAAREVTVRGKLDIDNSQGCVDEESDLE